MMTPNLPRMDMSNVRMSQLIHCREGGGGGAEGKKGGSVSIERTMWDPL